MSSFVAASRMKKTSNPPQAQPKHSQSMNNTQSMHKSDSTSSTSSTSTVPPSQPLPNNDPSSNPTVPLPPLLIVQPKHSVHLFLPPLCQSLSAQRQAVIQPNSLPQEQRPFIIIFVSIPLLKNSGDLNVQLTRSQGIQPSIELNTKVLSFDDDVQYRDYRKISKSGYKYPTTDLHKQPPLVSDAIITKFKDQSSTTTISYEISNCDKLIVSLPPRGDPTINNDDRSIIYRSKYQLSLPFDLFLQQLHNAQFESTLDKTFVDALILQPSISAQLFATANILALKCSLTLQESITTIQNQSISHEEKHQQCQHQPQQQQQQQQPQQNLSTTVSPPSPAPLNMVLSPTSTVASQSSQPSSPPTTVEPPNNLQHQQLPPKPQSQSFRSAVVSASPVTTTKTSTIVSSNQPEPQKQLKSRKNKNSQQECGAQQSDILPQQKQSSVDQKRKVNSKSPNQKKLTQPPTTSVLPCGLTPVQCPDGDEPLFIPSPDQFDDVCITPNEPSGQQQLPPISTIKAVPELPSKTNPDLEIQHVSSTHITPPSSPTQSQQQQPQQPQQQQQQQQQQQLIPSYEAQVLSYSPEAILSMSVAERRKIIKSYRREATKARVIPKTLIELFPSIAQQLTEPISSHSHQNSSLPGEDFYFDEHGLIHHEAKKLAQFEELKCAFDSLLNPSQPLSPSLAAEVTTSSTTLQTNTENDYDMKSLYDQTVLNTLQNIVSPLQQPTPVLSSMLKKAKQPSQQVSVVKGNIAPIFNACTLCYYDFKITCHHPPFSDSFNSETFDVKLARVYKKNNTIPLPLLKQYALNLHQLNLSPQYTENDIYYIYGVGSSTNVPQSNQHKKSSTAPQLVNDSSISKYHSLPNHAPNRVQINPQIIIRTINDKDVEAKSYNTGTFTSPNPSNDRIESCIDLFDPDFPFPESNNSNNTNNNNNTHIKSHNNQHNTNTTNSSVSSSSSLLPKSFQSILTHIQYKNKVDHIITDQDYVFVSAQRQFMQQKDILANNVIPNYLSRFLTHDDDNNGINNDNKQLHKQPLRSILRSPQIIMNYPKTDKVKVKGSNSIPSHIWLQEENQVKLYFEFKIIKNASDTTLTFSNNRIDGVIVANGNRISIKWLLQYEINPIKSTFSVSTKQNTITIILIKSNPNLQWTSPLTIDQ